MLKRILTFVTIVAIATICCVGTSSQNIAQLQASAENGDAEAMAELGYCYLWEEGVEKSNDKAFMWINKAADAGNARAVYLLGFCYAYGNGTTKDLTKAFDLYSKAADLGNTDAMITLGNCYGYGEGVPKDPKKAFEYYRKAAELGNVTAMGILAMCYDDGDGVAVNKNEAYKWYEKAVNNGNDREHVKNRYTALKFAGSTWTMKNGDRTIAVYTFNKDNTYTAKYTSYLHAPTGCYWTFTETGTWSLDKGLVTPTPKTFSRPTVRVSPSANWQQKKYPSVMAAMTPGEYSKFLRDDVSASDNRVFKMKSDSQMDVKKSRLTSDYDNTWGTLVKKSGPAASSGKKSATKKRSGSRRR